MPHKTPEARRNYQHEYHASLSKHGREKHRANAQKWNAANPTRRTAIQLKSKLSIKYGISVADYEALMHKQEGRCAICRGTNGSRRLVVDHDHATGAVRGLLCGNCNSVLGHARDCVLVLMAAIDYLSER